MKRAAGVAFNRLPKGPVVRSALGVQDRHFAVDDRRFYRQRAIPGVHIHMELTRKAAGCDVGIERTPARPSDIGPTPYLSPVGRLNRNE
jgi:hypothetical protein